MIGTTLLVFVGLSLVILMFGEGSPIATALPSEGSRRLITGFLFGSTGALIAISPVGVHSGAHINPIVTLAFRLMGKLDLRTTLGYVLAQLTRLRPRAAGGAGVSATPGVARDGPERGVRRHVAGSTVVARKAPAARKRTARMSRAVTKGTSGGRRRPRPMSVHRSTRGATRVRAGQRSRVRSG